MLNLEPKKQGMMMPLKWALVFLAGLAVTTGSAAQDPYYTPPLPSGDFPYPESGVKIGQGWDSFNQRATTASCVDVAESRIERASFETHVEQLQSSYSLITKSTTSISAAYGGFGFKASGKYSDSSATNLNTDDQNYLFTFESSNGSTFATPPDSHPQDGIELSDQTVKALTSFKSDAAQQSYVARIWSQPGTVHSGAIKLNKDSSDLRTKDRKSFDRICGDGFVSAIHRGARISLLLSQKFTSSDQANNLIASLSASGFGLSANGGYSVATQRLATTANLSYRIFQEGGIPLKPVALPQLSNGTFFDVNSILPSADQLVAAPVAFSVTVTPYENAIAPLDNQGPFPSPFRLMPISDYYLALLDEYRLVDNILTTVRLGPNAANYPFDPRLIQIYGGEQGLQRLYDEIQFDLAFLEDVIYQCYSARTRSCTIPSAVQGAKANLGNKLTELQKNEQQLTALRTAKNAELLTLTPAGPAAEDRARMAGLAADIAGLNAYLPTVGHSISRIQELSALITDDGLDPKFFQKFYQYVASTPLPKAAYSGSDFSALQSLSFLTASAGDKEKQLAASNDALRRASLTFRLTPWKHFFCQTLKQSSMCVSEAALHDLVLGTLPGISSADLTPVAPPPPPPPAPRPDPVPDRFSFQPHGPCGIGGALC
jgi:hypothetical protein